jgi:hypothetical protein
VRRRQMSRNRKARWWSDEVSDKCKIGKVYSLKRGVRVTWSNLCFSECRVHCGCFGIFGSFRSENF